MDPHFPLAGLWESRFDDGRMLRTCTVVTVPANADLAPVHNRMPPLVAENDWDRWLDPAPRPGPRWRRSLYRPPTASCLSIRWTVGSTTPGRRAGSSPSRFRWRFR
ncbi:MAG: hypothetical protein Ct9H300mP12_00250 [Acidimicrobiales bacterium]|nr:MAG: hypothetical protein Ct9H300mP12_00250 [Acidimicrobiales bacterium]